MFTPVFPRRHSAVFAKHFAEVLAGGEAGLECDIRDAAVASGEEFARSRYAMPLEIVIGGEAGGAFEGLEHAGAAQAEVGGEIGHLDGFIVMLAQEGFGGCYEIGGARLGGEGELPQRFADGHAREPAEQGERFLFAAAGGEGIRFVHELGDDGLQFAAHGAHGHRGVLALGIHAAQILARKGGVQMRVAAAGLELDAAELGGHAHILPAPVTRVRWGEEELAAGQLDIARACEFIGGGAFGEKDEFDVFVRVPGDPMRAPAADGAHGTDHGQANVHPANAIMRLVRRRGWR